MTIKEKTLDILHQLGFMPELINDDLGYSFEFEGLTMIYSPEPDETECIHFIVPAIFDITDENRSAVLEALMILTRKVKFVQPTIMFNDQVWLNYQHFMENDEVSQKLVEHIVRVLAFSTSKFHTIINGEENDN